MQATQAAAAEAKARIRVAAQARILDAAADVFAREGRVGATMAAIARSAGMSPATVHYYFRNKAALYDAVLDRTLSLWLSEISSIEVTSNPIAAITAYIHAKMRVSYAHPAASRIVATEVLQGGTRIRQFLEADLMPLLSVKLRLIERWQQSGQLKPIDARHLFFLIWAATEFYANSAIEVTTVLGVPHLEEAEFKRAAESLVTIVTSGVEP